MTRSPQERRLPRSVCFRITRACNAHCPFCLAPPEGPAPDGATLAHRLGWLADHGVSVLNFCGGEPTLHPALPDLLEQAHTRGLRNRMTTNGLAVTDALVSAFRKTRTLVKVSLHGNQAWHDRVVGPGAFDRVMDTLSRLKTARVETILQATVLRNGLSAIEDVAATGRMMGIRRLDLLPFIPRGRGAELSDRFGLPPEERKLLGQQISRLRQVCHPGLDIHLLDFRTATMPTVDWDGQIHLEGATARHDQWLCRIPEPEDTRLPGI